MTAILYGGQGAADTASDLYTLDDLVGAGSSLGASGFALTGIAIDPTDPTKLYFATSSNSAANPKSLGVIDLTAFPAGGSVTLIGPFNASSGAAMSDLAFDDAGNLFSWAVSGPDGFCSINKATGQATSLGGGTISSFAGGGMTFDGDGTLWIYPRTDHGSIYTINPATGVATSVGTLDGYTIGRFVAAATLGPGGVIWASLFPFAASDSSLVTIGPLDPDTLLATVTLVSLSDVSRLDALAWTPTPAAGDTIPPSLVSITARTTVVTLSYDEPLAGSPITSEFAVTANGSPVAVTAVAVSGSSVLLTLASPVFVGDTVLVSYTA